MLLDMISEICKKKNYVTEKKNHYNDEETIKFIMAISKKNARNCLINARLPTLEVSFRKFY